jgi:hypothetical protein
MLVISFAILVISVAMLVISIAMNVIIAKDLTTFFKILHF